MRARSFNYTTILLAGAIVSSCDCYQNVSGTVLDNETHKPLDSVYVHKKTRDSGNYTNDKGEFKLREIDGGLFGCPPMSVILTKDNYEQKIIDIENASHATIYLSRKE